MIEARLRRELEEAFANRAHLYRLLLAELEAELGAEAAERLLARVLERRGREVGALLFADLPPGEPLAAAERFLAVSPDEGRLYPHTLERDGEGVTVQVHRCPLQDAWRASGLPGERIAALCRLAGAFDRGLFETAGVAFAAETWRPGRAGCCRIRLARPGAAAAGLGGRPRLAAGARIGDQPPEGRGSPGDEPDRRAGRDGAGGARAGPTAPLHGRRVLQDGRGGDSR